MDKRYLIANWKMNIPGEGVGAFLSRLAGWDRRDSVDIVIAPPCTFIAEVARWSNGSVGVAAQNCSDQPSGAFTGEVSAAMLRAAGATHVILGHSERRTIFGETDEWIGRKIRAALDEGLVPILCIGEVESIRESGGTRTLLERQILTASDASGGLPPNTIVAYEPVWAIGTGKNATPHQVAETHSDILELLRSIIGREFPVLYGGSVSADNAAALAAVAQVHGFLVGGASLVSSKFAAIHDAL